ncbi:lipopolysaccharide assembly protein LapA domain-containing protein [Sedimentibacter sp.]|uniref:lipopolysaccharide assembly protein LapA domain-containing protein n=1 Tax=Sedimentibacter sp. TaxID=1960295 RepID=UPI0028AC9B00|nr:lipopolysaccharide assembly protein LapA domain-containing protein [Sedimentibacter sp.]
MQIGFIVVLIIAIFVAIFSIQNGDIVSLDLFLARVDMPLAVIIMVCIIIGAVLVLALGTTRQFKKRSESKEMKNKLKTLEGDKMLADKTVKDLQQEIQGITEKNNELLLKISELEENSKIQKETIESLNNELELKNDSNTINESVGTELSDEKSEVESE